MSSSAMLRGFLLCTLAAGLCGCDKVQELWAKIDPLSRPDPPPVSAEENPRVPPPAMPPPPEVRSKTSPTGDRSGHDRIMSLGMESPVPRPKDDRRQLWDPDPLRRPPSKPAGDNGSGQRQRRKTQGRK